MPTLRSWSLTPLLLILSTTIATAQAKPKTSAPPIVQGTVTDSAHHVLANAQVFATDSKGKILSSTRTNAKGQFQLRALKTGTAYRFAARQIGYASGTSDLMHLNNGDTLDIQFVLDPTENTLAAVKVVSNYNAAYHIASTDIAKHADRDALDVVINERPRMLGDTYKNCMRDTSRLTVDNRFIPRAPPSLSMDRSQPLRLFINGVWHGERGIKDILADIPASEIAEINYVDCWDEIRPELRNSLLVVLKPGVAY